MQFKASTLFCSLLFTGSVWAAPLSISTPAVNAPVTAANQNPFVMTGACETGNVVKIDATDTAGKKIDLVWAPCNGAGFWAQLNLSSLKDGNITLKAFQVVNNKTTTLTRNVVKSTAAPAVQLTFNTTASSVTAANQSSFEFTGACVSNNVVKVSATDSAGKTTDLVWAPCNGNGYWGLINVSALKDGALTFKSLQVVNNVSSVVNKSLNKVTAVVTPPATPVTAVSITTPVADYTVTNADQAALVVKGACNTGSTVKVSVVDAALKSTAIASVVCANSAYSQSMDVSSLADGALTVNAQQTVNNATTSAARNIKKTITVVVVPPANKIIFGVNGHDLNQTAYPLNQAEARFKILSQKNLRSYRFDLVVGYTQVLDTLIPLAKKYNIILRPMIYPSTQAATYAFVKKYANDIKIWEIANEQDYDVAGAQARINEMVKTYKGVKQASDELGANLKTTINVMACNNDDRSASARCAGKSDGVMWFLNMARNSGFLFDHVSFHYYPGNGDKGYWMDKYLSQLRLYATTFNTKIFYNEMNCAEIYQGNTDGGFKGDGSCYDGMTIALNELVNKYSDVIAEVNFYEMVDEPDHPVTHERHFGVMYDLNTPKPLLDLYSEFANK